MSLNQEKIEALGGSDVATADGYVLCTNNESRLGRIMASAVPSRVRVKGLSLFHRDFGGFVAKQSGDVNFAISDYHPKYRCVITFEAPERDFVTLLASFLQYLEQSQLLSNPIVCCKFKRK